METRPVIILAMNQELTTDAHLRRKFRTAMGRSRRQASRYDSVDLVDMERQVEENLLATQLQMDGEYLGLLDVINRAKNGRHHVDVTPDNVKDHLSLANTVTLNGIFLYSYLKKRGFSSRIVQNWAAEKALFEELLEANPLAVVVSSTYLSMETIKEVGTWVKKRNSAVPIIAGGPLVNKVLQEGTGLASTTKKWLQGFREAVDYFVIESQGEKTLVRLLEKLSRGESIDTVENLAVSKPEGWRFTPRMEEPVDMDDGAVAWDEIPAEYLRPTIPVNTSRGCVYTCRFCTYRKLVKGIHYKSLECLREEFECLARIPTVSHVRFTDDNLTASGKRLMEICRMLIDMGVPFTWTSFARPDAITAEKAELMSRAGCVLVEMGLESGSQKILRNMDKRIGVDQARRAIEILNQAGIAPSGAFIVGFPGETEETLWETVKLINETGLPYYRLNFFAFSKGMSLYDEKDKYGLSGLGFAWKHDTLDSAQASVYFGQMIGQITHAVSDGLSSTWETFKLLSGQGLKPSKIFRLFQATNELNRKRMADGENGPDWWKKHQDWWIKFESLLAKFPKP